MNEEVTMIEQHERLRVPQGWTGQDRTLVTQLERVHDDIYRHFGRLGLKDLSADVRELLSTVTKTHAGLCPQLPSSGTTKYLRQDGTWQVPPGDTSNCVKLTGDQTIGGYKYFNAGTVCISHNANQSRYRTLGFWHNATTSTESAGYIRYDLGNATNVTAGKFSFFEKPPKATASPDPQSIYEAYHLPAVDTSLSSSKDYYIYTSKNVSAGDNVSITRSGENLTIAATDTTYTSKTAASGGTAVSLCTTGEKYTWNQSIKLNTYVEVAKSSSKSVASVPNGSLIVFAYSTAHRVMAMKTSNSTLRELLSNGTSLTLSVSSGTVTATNGLTGYSAYLLIISP